MNFSSEGGGICDQYGYITVTDCVFKDNTAGYGGGISARASTAIVTNCTFTGNRASVVGGGLDAFSKTVTNCIFWGNTANNGGPELYVETGGSATVTYSDVQGGFPGTGNINADPLFMNVGSGDLHLQPGSPCIDKGSSSAPDLPSTDLDGNPRVVNGVPDMGAYEFVPINTTVTVANVSGTAGQSVTLSAVLTRNNDNAVLSGRSLSFYVNNVYVGTANTDSKGTAQTNYTIPGNLSAGTQLSLKVVRLSNSQYNGSTGFGTLTVAADGTSLTVANVSGKAGQSVTLSAVLRQTSNNAVLPGRSVTFYVNNAYVGTPTTDSTGTASVSYTIPGNLSAGTQLTIKVVRLSNAQNTGSTGFGTLTVSP